MGTNYYLMKPAKRCNECGSTLGGGEEIHIGKSSIGWHFSFETTKTKTIDAWKLKMDEWLATGGWIAPEYNRDWPCRVDPKEFWEMVNVARESPECAAKHSDEWHRAVCCDGVDLCEYSYS